MSSIERGTSEARRLLGEVRKGGRMADVFPFLSHVRNALREAESAMVEAGRLITETGRLDDEMFSKVYAAGALVGSISAMCEDHRHDPSNHVRLACAAAIVLIEKIELHPTDRAVVETMQARLGRMS
jgi:hypothetical protein